MCEFQLYVITNLVDNHGELLVKNGALVDLQ
jgi:hypothetical protein